VRIEHRLPLWFVAVAALSAVVAALFLDRALDRRITDRIADDLERQARIVQGLAAREEDLRSAADALADRVGRQAGCRVTIIAGDGTVLGDTDLDGEALRRVENHAGRPEIVAAMRSGRGRSVRFSHTIGEWLLYVALRVDPDDPARGVVRVALPLTEVRRAEEAVRGPILAAALVSTGLAGGLGWLASRRLARRLKGIAGAAASIAEGRLETRAAPGGRDEVGDLARSLNAMAAQLDERLALLARERNQLRTVLDGMVEGVLLVDATGTILLSNGAFERIFAVRGGAAGRRPLEVARLPLLQRAVEEALEAPAPVEREIEIGGGREKVVHASLASLRDQGGAVIGAVAVFYDVTEIRRLERTRRDFVANVSHELRTPLTAIKGYAETLLEGGLAEPARATEMVGVIQRHADRLRALIEDLLDLAAVEQGKARLEVRPVAVGDAIAQAESAIRPAADSKGLTLVADLSGSLPRCLADRDRLAQVLINLLDNAVKFTPKGGTIRITAAAADGRMVLAVSDTGPGIPPRDLGRIFERFYRVDPSRDRREGGTGLGLAIAKHLVQAMGGTIEAESVPGSGATFRVILRIAS
jgi:two-component system phosphate regulon sensor histidine kinase PhoR